MADVDAQVHAAKAFLLKASPDTKNNLYDHLSDCLSVILKEQTSSAVDIFENISSAVKKERLQPVQDTIQEQEGPSSRVNLAEKQKLLFKKSEGEGDGDGDEEVSVPFPNIMEISRHFESAGIGLGREEFFRISLALKQLTADEPLVSVKFWGKVFGTKADYIVAEAEYQDGEGEEDEKEEEEGREEGGREGGDEDAEGDNESSESGDKDEPPKSQWKPPPTVPKEEPKTGANKKIYFACNNPGERWVRLPNITPVQIVAARKISKLFTGDPKAAVVTYPPFPGMELSYLRAQIARITSNTHISPNGYFHSPEEEEEDDDEGLGAIEPNPEFEVDKITEYLDIANWCHHINFLLPQGRTVWWNPVKKADDEFEEEEDDEDDEKEQPEEPEPEEGPPLLTSAAEDEKIDGMLAWSTKLSSAVLPQYAAAIASSNLWPGAHSYAVGKTFENIYIGWGKKYSSRPFNPKLPPMLQEEFPAGADIAETVDPTAEQEKALRAAQDEADAQLEEEEEPDEESDED